MRPGYSAARVPNCSAMISGAWFGSITPPAPTRIVEVPPATCPMTTAVAALGIPGDALNGKHQVCPSSGEGKDRFRFTDHNGTGSYFCHCDDRAREGKAGGVSLLMCCKGWDYATACAEIDKVVGNASVTPPQQISAADARQRVRNVASACKPVDYAVTEYLRGRGLAVPSGDVRQASLQYWERPSSPNARPTKLGTFDAMVCMARTPEGKVCAAHITYIAGNADLTAYAKAEVPSPRKVEGTLSGGAAIRLFPLPDGTEEMGIAEGVETALAAALLYDIPVWSCVDAAGVAAFVAPPGIKRLFVFGDNDPGFAGQCAAYTCARRHAARHVDCVVMIPDRTGTDWNDSLREKRQEAA